MPRITININLKAIPGDLIKRVGDAAYVNLDINELRGGADERGNDHSVSVYVPQDRREDYPDRIYIGRGRQYQDHTGGADFSRERARRQPVNVDNDLPW